MSRLSEIAYTLCLLIEKEESNPLLTECSVIASVLRQKLIDWEDIRPLTDHEKQMIDDAWEKHKGHRFNETFCSQCGKNFGPGDHGFSSCKIHTG